MPLTTGISRPHLRDFLPHLIWQRLLPGPLILALLTSCSLGSEVPQHAAAPATASIELYLSRASMGGGEFENYKLIDNTLFVECGRYQRGRHIPTFDSLIEVESSLRETISLPLAEVVQAVTEKHPFAAKGASSDMFDPGELRMVVETGDQSFEVETSLDSIATPASGPERRVNEVALAMRDASNLVLCNNRTFFGLGRKE